MKKILFLLIVFGLRESIFAQERLIYHTIQVDNSGNILPWNNDDPGLAYDQIIHLIWNFWETMRTDLNGLPYYMNRQVWRPDFNDPRGIGGDQIQMAMSSWRMYFVYSGNEKAKENIKFMADYYLSHGLSSSTARWPNIPFPYNTLVYSGQYDGDMVSGKDYTQPDKAGSFGIELLQLYKMMSNERYPHATEKRYLDAAINIANTLASKIKTGNENASPLPFKVNALTDEIGNLKSNSGDKSDAGLSSYTSNWSATIELFMELKKLNQGNVEAYDNAITLLINWMKKYPMKNNKWGPFFEDIPGWSDTQINAMTWARFIMNHREYFPDWKTDVQKIIDWVYKTVPNNSWKKYGVTVINEQTAYQTPGNSHTARQAADELLFSSLTEDSSRVSHAIRQLNWATYMVDGDGKNRYPRDENWLTDGYGDYVRHYLRSMAAFPELAPNNSNHILSSSSTIQHAEYNGQINKFITPSVGNIDPTTVTLFYRTFDQYGIEKLRLTKKPKQVLLNMKSLAEISNLKKEGYTWTPFKKGGLLTVKREAGTSIVIIE